MEQAADPRAGAVVVRLDRQPSRRVGERRARVLAGRSVDRHRAALSGVVWQPAELRSYSATGVRRQADTRGARWALERGSACGRVAHRRRDRGLRRGCRRTARARGCGPRRDPARTLRYRRARVGAAVAARGRVGVVTNAGGPAILCADACEPPASKCRNCREAATEARARIAAACGDEQPVDMLAAAGPPSSKRPSALAARARWMP